MGYKKRKRVLQLWVVYCKLSCAHKSLCKRKKASDCQFRTSCSRVVAATFHITVFMVQFIGFTIGNGTGTT